MNSNKPVSKLLSSISSNSAKELGDKLGEVALDAILSDGVVKNIPIIGTALTLLKAGNDTHAYFFAKKIIKFLTEIEVIPYDERKSFVEKYHDDEKGFDKVGETLLMIVDSANSIDTATFLGKAMRLYILGELTKYKLDIYVHLISNLNPYLIAQVHQCYKSDFSISVNEDAKLYLISLGLLEGRMSIRQDSRVSLRPKKTPIGREFYINILA